jgi:hypothetical protein
MNSLLDIYYCISIFNTLLTFILLGPLNGLNGWFGTWALRHDGHIIGLGLKLYAYTCFILGLILLVAVWDIINPMISMRLTLVFLTSMSIIPFVIGREIRSGSKWF